jgi:hypothetical protein
VCPSKPESDKFDLISEKGSVNIIALNKWKMKDMVSNVTIDVCEPDPSELPVSLRKEPASEIVTGLNGDQRHVIAVYPNPVHDQLVFRIITGKNYKLTIYDQSGKKYGNYELRNGTANISVNGFPRGIYYVEIISEDGERQYRKVIVSD